MGNDRVVSLAAPAVVQWKNVPNNTRAGRDAEFRKHIRRV